MSSKKKPAAKGPFFFFMLEFRRQEEARGKKFHGGLEQVQREAGPHWNNLDDEAREIYKTRAQEYKKAPKQNYGEKYTAQGIAFSVVEKQQQERMTNQENTSKAIVELIETASDNNELETLEVVFISFNHFCKINELTYVPAEMGAVRYNLSNGVVAQLHEFINPVKLPLGLAYESSIISEESHQLPIPPNAFGESDFSIILEKLVAFIDYDKKPFKRGFPLFVDAKEVKMAQSILDQFCEDTKKTYNFLICPLNEFFFRLKRATEKYGMDICAFPAKTIADILLKKDPYEYTSGIACNYHEDNGISRFCALSRVIRWSFMISDNCCLDLGIDLIPGLHLPQNADTTLSVHLTETVASKSMSFVSASDMTHVSMPQLTKIRKKSPFRGDDINGSVIYSSRSGTSRKESHNKHESKRADSTNPFHHLDVSETSDWFPSESVITNKSAYAESNPFSRQLEVDEFCQQRDLGLACLGRGSLIATTSKGKGSRNRYGGEFSGTNHSYQGRGMSFSSPPPSVDLSSQYSDED
ncbi:protein maelstrom homolog [Uranotaenia lowii]|uniref:protein maelstrom homolog n=1 Tax=Uranotaenia lowii TaxID=190385 RepID=UPI00247A989D|nr:protein maelstrom homolog [Uranotaenia lowii]